MPEVPFNQSASRNLETRQMGQWDNYWILIGWCYKSWGTLVNGMLRDLDTSLSGQILSGECESAGYSLLRPESQRLVARQFVQKYPPLSYAATSFDILLLEVSRYLTSASNLHVIDLVL